MLARAALDVCGGGARAPRPGAAVALRADAAAGVFEAVVAGAGTSAGDGGGEVFARATLDAWKGWRAHGGAAQGAVRSVRKDATSGGASEVVVRVPAPAAAASGVATPAEPARTRAPVPSETAKDAGTSDTGGMEDMLAEAGRLSMRQLQSLARSDAVRDALRVRGVPEVLRHIDAQWERGARHAEAALEAAQKDHPAFVELCDAMLTAVGADTAPPQAAAGGGGA